jgi:hypothetical protein
MKIEFKQVDGRSCPLVICDVCAEAIKDVGLGMVKWDREGGEVIVCHKHQCDHTSAGGANAKWPWQELGVHMIYLCQNMKMDFKEELERADQMEGLL